MLGNHFKKIGVQLPWIIVAAGCCLALSRNLRLRQLFSLFSSGFLCFCFCSYSFRFPFFWVRLHICIHIWHFANVAGTVRSRFVSLPLTPCSFAGRQGRSTGCDCGCAPAHARARACPPRPRRCCHGASFAPACACSWWAAASCAPCRMGSPSASASRTLSACTFLQWEQCDRSPVSEGRHWMFTLVCCFPHSFPLCLLAYVPFWAVEQLIWLRDVAASTFTTSRRHRWRPSPRSHNFSRYSTCDPVTEAAIYLILSCTGF